MSRILVTGAAGFIGYHTAKRLLDAGHSVLGIDSITEYYDPKLKWDRLAQLENYPAFSHREIALEDAPELEEALQSFLPEYVVHLAAQAGVRYSIESPETYISSNVIGTQVLLETLKHLAPRHVMVASTSSAYGGTRDQPFSETFATQSPMSLYAATKIAVEAIAHSYSHLWSLPTTCFRFFTVYGPWGRPDMALFKFVSAIRQAEPIDVYGQGKMKRDFTYIDDLVAAIQSLLDQEPQVGRPVGEFDTLSPVAPFRIVNIGGGAPTGLLEFIEAIESALGTRANQRLLPMQPGDVVETFADVRLLHDLIGIVPSTSVGVGVQRFVRWYDTYYATRNARAMNTRAELRAAVNG